jgi:hypothetical protein
MAVLAALFALSGTALADDWLPHPANAGWQYLWTDSAYNPNGTVENVDVQQQQGTSFTLAWADPQDQIPPASETQLLCPSGADIGTMTFGDTNTGLVNTDWNSCPPPSDMPILCPTTQCANSLASTFFNVIWGNRSPVLSEPLLQGATWNSRGGAQNDVSSTSQYMGLQLVKVPAFPNGVTAAVVQTTITQAGALGDPYGSGVRTTWWVYGVGPVKVVFDHEGGSSAPVTSAELLATSLKPLADRPDQNYFPLTLGVKGTYRWTNKKHLKQPEIETMSVAAAVNRTARIDVKSVSGPIKAVGQYVFSAGLDGITNISAATSAASLAKFPKLGHARHFFTPMDLMLYGFNPVLPAYPIVGSKWQSGNVASFHVYGVTGSTMIVGINTVHVPAGTFQAVELRSVLTQKGHPFGSGVRTMWLAANRGLVKLVFQHRDGSTSVVQLIK